jgi:hypothetical protein
MKNLFFFRVSHAKKQKGRGSAFWVIFPAGDIAESWGSAG